MMYHWEPDKPKLNIISRPSFGNRESGNGSDFSDDSSFDDADFNSGASDEFDEKTAFVFAPAEKLEQPVVSDTEISDDCNDVDENPVNEQSEYIEESQESEKTELEVADTEEEIKMFDTVENPEEKSSRRASVELVVEEVNTFDERKLGGKSVMTREEVERMENHTPGFGPREGIVEQIRFETEPVEDNEGLSEADPIARPNNKYKRKKKVEKQRASLIPTFFDDRSSDWSKAAPESVYTELSRSLLEQHLNGKSMKNS